MRNRFRHAWCVRIFSLSKDLEVVAPVAQLRISQYADGWVKGLSLGKTTQPGIFPLILPNSGERPRVGYAKFV